jgi:hypothetical protein
MKHISVALWGHPRSTSTALERVFMERGDFQVFHEPFSYVYFMHESRAEIPHKHPDPNHPKTYEAVKAMMENARRDQAVFHKDFPYHVIDHLMTDREYLRGQVNTFLIRDPEEAVLSHASVHPGVTKDVLGYAELHRLFNEVAETTGEAPIVINSRDLTERPAETLAAYCEKIGIPFTSQSLNWSSGSRPEWSTWKEWHTDVAASTGIAKPVKNYTVNLGTHPHLRSFIDYCHPFYEKLNQFSLTTGKEKLSCA